MFDDVPLSDGQLSVLVLIVAVVASAVAAPMLMMPDSAKPVKGGETSATPTATPAKGTVQEFTERPTTPRGPAYGDARMRSVPDSHIRDLSNSDGSAGPPQPDSVRASAGTQTMRIDTTTVDGEPALVLSDDQTHDGRWVSVSAEWLERVHGEVPSTVTIQHESGTVYTEKVRVEGDNAAFYVRGFSANTVTFSGEVEINASPASDGSSSTYEIADLDDAGNVSVNLTGVTNTETETSSWSNVANGDSVTVDAAGNVAPSSQSVTFTGEESVFAESRSGTGVSTGSSGISVGGDESPRNAEITFTGNTQTSNGDAVGTISLGGSESFANPGNIEPTGPSGNNNPTLQLTGNSKTVEASDRTEDITNYMFGDNQGEITVKNVGGTIETVTVDVYLPDANAVSDVYLVTGETADGTYGEGTKVADAVSFGSDVVTIDITDVTVPDGTTITLEFVTAPESSAAAAVRADDSVSEGLISTGAGGVKNQAADAEVTTGPANVQATIDGSTVSFGDLGSGGSATNEFDIKTGDSSISVSGDGGSVDYTLTKTDRTATENPGVDVDGDGTDEASYTGILTEGQTATKSVSGLSTGSQSLDWSRTAGTFDWSLAFDRVEHTENPSVDVDDDGTDEASVSGTIAPGDTVTKSISGLALGSNTLTVSTASSTTTGFSASWTEKTQTTDPSVELNNGNWANHTGTLADGETVSLTIEKSAVQQGTNTVQVSVGDGTLSNDAPALQVEMRYSHDATDRQSVDYAAEEWTSRYNVSQTYSSSRGNATLTIPFDSSEVVSMRAVEFRVNQSGGWSSMSTSNYVLNGTTLEADLSGAYGGTIPSGTTFEVRANASKIDVINGSVTVVEATAVGQDLDTEVEVVSTTPGFRIETADGRVHYAHNASYATEDYWVVDQRGQRLHLPNAQAGDTLRVSRMPVTVTPTNGDVHVTAANVSSTEPAIAVEPGQVEGNNVQVTFENASDGTEYALYSQTNDVVRDSGTASSPLTLEDDDSTETLKFLADDGSSSSGSSGGSSSSAGGVGVVAPSPDDFTGNLLPLSLVALALAGLIVVSRNDDEITEAGGDAAAGIEGALGGIPVVGPVVGSGLAGLVRSTAQFTRAVAKNRTVTVGLMGAVALAAIQSGVVQVPDSTLPILVLVGVAAGSFVALRETGNWDMRVWVGIVGVSTLVTLVTISDADPVAAITSSDVFPLLALGGVYLGYRGVQALQAATKPDETVVTLEVDDSARTDGGDEK